MLDRGNIVEIGNHQELMARKNHYHRLYEAQMRNIDTEGELVGLNVAHKIVGDQK